LYAGKGAKKMKNIASGEGEGLYAGKSVGGTRKGRFAKGSPEAKAWGEKMKMLRKK